MLARDQFEPALGLFVVRKPALFGAKGVGVVITSALDEPRGMFDVQHLVIEHILDKPFGNIRRVQCLADDDGVMRGVVMSHDAARAALRPCQSRSLNLAVEVTAVHYRDKPILTNALMADYPSNEQSGFFSIIPLKG